MPDEASLDRLRTPSLTRDQILEHPLFLTIEVEIATHLVGIHEETPRLARLKASHQKWIMTQMLYALQLERDPLAASTGLTASRLYDVLARYAVVSRNTVASYLAELVAYKFLRDAPDSQDKRKRPLEITDAAAKAMYSWFLGHMVCLDRLDGGNRAERSESDPALFRLGQPYAARALIDDPAWRNLPETVSSFIWAESGGMVLHELISRLPSDKEEDGRIFLGEISIAEIAQKYAISATNVKRMFAPAETAGLLGWERPRRRGRLWFSPRFLRDYFYWQSVKFAALDEAVHWAEQQSRSDTASGVTRNHKAG